MPPLRVYKSLPEWTAQTLPRGFQRQHNTREGTWARLTVHAGTLRFTHLNENGEETASHVIDAAMGPQLVAPRAWHKVEPLDDALRCRLEFLCEPDRYLEKKHGLTAPHSEVRALSPMLADATGRTALDLGSGRGRNSFFLAERGLNVTAVDRSDTAITTLRQIQAAEGFELVSRLYDINRAALAEVLPSGSVDHIISTVVFQFLEAARIPAILHDMQAVTRSGGLHLIVTPITSEELPCPIAFPFLPGKGELEKHYHGWDIVTYREHIGEFHKRDEHGDRYKAEFATLIARKPT